MVKRDDLQGTISALDSANEIRMEQFKVKCLQSVGSTTRESINFDYSEDDILKEMLYKLEAYVLAQKIVDDNYTFTFTFDLEYASWWQHFKDSYAPMWFKERYPIKRKSHVEKRHVNFSRYATYPKANMAISRDSKFYKENLGGLEVIKDKVDPYAQ